MKERKGGIHVIGFSGSGNWSSLVPEIAKLVVQETKK
jgi:hypothetical protein